MDIGAEFEATYKELPLIEGPVDGLRTSTGSHRTDINHLPNRGCERCVGEIAQNVMRDAISEGMTVAVATEQALLVLRLKGFSVTKALAMLKDK